MKAITSFETAPLGLVGHLRAALEAWQHERSIQKAIEAKSANDAPVAQIASHLTAAELYENRQKQIGTFADTADVLSGPVLNWPSPSRKHH